MISAIVGTVCLLMATYNMLTDREWHWLAFLCLFNMNVAILGFVW